MVNVAVAPFASLQMVHIPVAGSYDPIDGVYVKPALNGSLTKMFVASLGPLLVSVMVNVPLCPTCTGPLLVFVMITCADGFTVKLAVCGVIGVGL